MFQQSGLPLIWTDEVAAETNKRLELLFAAIMQPGQEEYRIRLHAFAPPPRLNRSQVIGSEEGNNIPLESVAKAVFCLAKTHLYASESEYGKLLISRKFLFQERSAHERMENCMKLREAFANVGATPEGIKLWMAKLRGSKTNV